jgi:L-malate glycosyltransferase
MQRLRREAVVRILHLVSYSIFSGPVPPTLGLALAQRRAGHTVWLACDTKRGNFDGFEEPAVPRLASFELAPPVRLTLSTKSTPLEVGRDLVALRRFVRRAAIDVVHAHMSHDHLLALTALPTEGPAQVRTYHAARSLARRRGQALVNRRADACITRCGAHRRLLVESFALPEERVRVVPSGVDTEALASLPALRAAARVRFNLPAEAFVVAHVAFLGRRGQEELCEAVARMASRPTLLFVGRGEAEADLRALVARLGLSDTVRFAGYLQGPELALAYGAADAAFVAQAGNDAAGRAALEAMAAGLPLVAVATEALAELCTDERGYPVANRHPDTIAEGLARLLADVEGRRTRGLAARALVTSERTFEREATATLAVYEEALARRQEKAGRRRAWRAQRAPALAGARALLFKAAVMAALALAAAILFFLLA